MVTSKQVKAAQDFAVKAQKHILREDTLLGMMIIDELKQLNKNLKEYNDSVLSRKNTRSKPRKKD